MYMYICVSLSGPGICSSADEHARLTYEDQKKKICVAAQCMCVVVFIWVAVVVGRPLRVSLYLVYVEERPHCRTYVCVWLCSYI